MDKLFVPPFISEVPLFFLIHKEQPGILCSEFHIFSRNKVPPISKIHIQNNNILEQIV